MKLISNKEKLYSKINQSRKAMYHIYVSSYGM